MSKWMYTGVLILSFLIGACTPNSNDKYAQQTEETQLHRHFMVFVDNGLQAANRGLMELEEEVEVVAAEADTMASKTVAELRSEYMQLSEEADSLVESSDSALDEERIELRDRLVELTRAVEKTRFDIIDESEQYREAAKRRLSELDQRMYELNSDIEQSGLTMAFEAMVERLETLREEAAASITQLDNTAGEEFAEVRDDVTNALSTFSARLTEAETEYETAAVEGTESMTSSVKSADDVPPVGRAEVEPIDQDN